MPRNCSSRDQKLRNTSAVTEVFGVGAGVAQIVVDQHRGLPGKLEAFAAFEAGDEVVETHHVGGSLGKLSAVFFAGAAREFPLFAGDFQSHGKLEFAAATRADELDLSGFFLLSVERA